MLSAIGRENNSFFDLIFVVGNVFGCGEAIGRGEEVVGKLVALLQ